MTDIEYGIRNSAPTDDEAHPHGGDWLENIVFGLNDGLVTTLVFIMAVSSVAASRTVLVALSEVLAGGISMTLGGYLSARTTLDIRRQRISTEQHEIEHEPDEERAELRRIYYDKGFRGTLLDRIVEHLTSDKDRWLRALLLDEHGMVDEHRRHPFIEGGTVGAAFIAGGLIPVLPFLTPLPHPQLLAFILTACTALGFGALKARYTLASPLRSGSEFLVIVTIGTLAGMVVGFMLHAL